MMPASIKHDLPSRRFRADVRLVSSRDRHKTGLQRGTIVLWFPAGIAERLWRDGPDAIGRCVGDLLEQRGVATGKHRFAGEPMDRNRVFIDALCESGVDDDRASDDCAAALGRSTFLMQGCGGLGSAIAVHLAALGARRFVLCDGDIIEASNLNRLFWAVSSDIGALKAERLSAHLARRFGARSEVAAFCFGHDKAADDALVAAAAEANAVTVLAGDVAVDARRFVTAFHARRRLGLYVHAGYVGRHCVAGPLVSNSDDACPFCRSGATIADDAGFVAPSAMPNNAVIAGLVVSQILLELAGRPAAIRGGRWTLDLATGLSKLATLGKDPKCTACRPS